MAVSQPQEHGESQENLKHLVDEICEAVAKLPEGEIGMNTETGVRTVRSRKRQIYAGGEIYEDGGSGRRITSPAYAYSVTVCKGSSESADGNPLGYMRLEIILTIEYKESHTVVKKLAGGCGEHAEFGVPSLVEKELRVTTKSLDHESTMVINSDNKEIMILPKITIPDLQLIVSFLQKAVAEHEKGKMVIAKIQKATTSRVAAKTRQALRSL